MAAGRLVAVLAAAATLLGGCTFGKPPPDQNGAPPRLPSPSPSPSDRTGDGQAAVEVVAKHLSVPWGLDFLPGGTALVTERDTDRLLKILPASAGPEGAPVTEVQTVAGVANGGDGGLLGLAVSPDYKTDQMIFIYYSTASDNRIAKLTLGGTPQPIVTGIPHGPTGNGGRIALRPGRVPYPGAGGARHPPSPPRPTSPAAQGLR